MRLCGSFARELARPVGAYLIVFTAWALLDRAVLTQVPAQTPPAGGTAAPAAPPAGGGRGRGVLSPFAKEALALLRAPLDRLTPVTDAMLRNPPPGDWLHWRRTYMVDGKQYIAMPVGTPGLQGNAALRTAPELGVVRGASSSMLWVWQLP